MGLLNQVYLTNDFINWADWVNDFCMLMVMEYFWFYGQSTLYLLHLNAGWPVQLYLAGFPPPKKKKKIFFHSKILSLIIAGSIK